MNLIIAREYISHGQRSTLTGLLWSYKMTNKYSFGE